MKHTRKLLLYTNGHMPKLLLPPPTLLETAGAAFQGMWSHISDQAARDAYEKAVRDQIIRDQVLENAAGGNVMTFILFNNLQSPFFQKHKVDIGEFLHAAGPALENFHDVLARLRDDLANQMGQEMDASKEDEEKEQSVEMEQESAEASPVDVLLGTNQWRKQAEEDSDSLAGQLSKMTSEMCLDAFYYTGKLEVMAMMAQGRNNYVEHTAKVNEVALLNARAMALHDHDNGESEHPEFEASDSNDDSSVAAQLDVLYEITHTYKVATDEPMPEEGVSKEPAESNPESNTDEKEATTTGTISYTNLAVAVFEGWLHRKGPEHIGEQLSWKLGMIRGAVEFPYSAPTVVHNKS